MHSRLVLVAAVVLAAFHAAEAEAQLKAGAAIVDVTPLQFPVLVNGGMTSRSYTEVKSKVYARAIVLDDSKERLAIVVVDSCMMPRPLLDDAKNLASTRTKIDPDHMLISATHTHTAPASMGCLGTSADPSYVPYLREKLAEAIATAEANLEPAQVGWAVENAADFTALRRWIRRPDRVADDPFGNPTVRANMHAGRNWDDVTGESGPEDPDLSLISIRSTSGRPIAVLANFSMHYFSGERGLSADYFGLFCSHLESEIGTSKGGEPRFVALMSHGCSGDIWRRDYTLTDEERGEEPTIESYAKGLSDIALKAYRGVSYSDDADLDMAEARMTLDYRVPDKQRLHWSQQVVEELGDRLPKTREEVYAREQLILHERQSTEIVVQALRIGDIGIATTPNETYALTGLKVKLQSPLPKTMVIELANGGDGYIPPPEQHYLGGYNTWAARSAGLEVQAEPKITEAALALLEEAAGKPRRKFEQTRGAAAAAVLAADPVAYWRMDDFARPRAEDHSGNGRDGIYEQGVAFFLAGPQSEAFCDSSEVNRAAHFAGGRLRANLPLSDQYTISLWFWNGMPTDARPTSGWILSRGRDHALKPIGEHIGVGGTEHSGKLVYQADGKTIAGRTEIPRWTWHQLVMVRNGAEVKVYLDGNPEPEISTQASPASFANINQWFFGGRCDNESNWEGRLDEIAVFDKALEPDQLSVDSK